MRTGSEWMARVVVVLLLLAIVGAIVFTVFANRHILNSTRAAILDSVSDLPLNEVGLLLTAQADGPQCVSRVETAAALFKAGKIRHILVSGDSMSTGYDEPSAIKEELVRLDVPAESITTDPGGFNILDALIRARKVFGQNSVTIIAHRVHSPRALFIADTLGMETVAFAAAETDAPYAWRHELLEVFARALIVVDVFVFHPESRFFGKPEPIVIRPTGRGAHGMHGGDSDDSPGTALPLPAP